MAKKHHAWTAQRDAPPFNSNVMCKEESLTQMNISGHGTTFTHGWLYRCSKMHLENAQENEEGRFHNAMSCIVFSAFAIEAYFNFLGDKHIENWEKEERRWSKWKKLRQFTTRSGAAISEGERPYLSISEAFEFRDVLAHGKTTTSNTPSNIELSDEGTVHVMFESDWVKFSTLENAERVFEDMVSFASQLHEGFGHGKHPFLSMYSGSHNVPYA